MHTHDGTQYKHSCKTNKHALVFTHCVSHVRDYCVDKYVKNRSKLWQFQEIHQTQIDEAEAAEHISFPHRSGFHYTFGI